MMAGLGWGNAAPSHAQTKIVEGFVSHGALQWPEYIATEFGWLKENGIELDMLVVGGGAAQQLAAGALNIGYSGYPDFIRATNQGAPVKILINGIAAPPTPSSPSRRSRKSPSSRARSSASAVQKTPSESGEIDSPGELNRCRGRIPRTCVSVR